MRRGKGGVKMKGGKWGCGEKARRGETGEGVTAARGRTHGTPDTLVRERKSPLQPSGQCLILQRARGIAHSTPKAKKVVAKLKSF